MQKNKIKKSSNLHLVRAGSTGAWFGSTCSLVYTQTIWLESAATVWTRDQWCLGRLPCSLIHLFSVYKYNAFRLVGCAINKWSIQQFPINISMTYWAEVHNQKIRAAKGYSNDIERACSTILSDKQQPELFTCQCSILEYIQNLLDSLCLATEVYQV